MNVVIAGPFGHGTLSDEAVLAGLLRHLAAGKHQATVMSVDPERTAEAHKVPAVKIDGPDKLLTNRELWKVLGKAHLLVLASAGAISASGQHPARTWLSLLEHAQTAGLQTAVVGIGAADMADAKERARVRRLLHNCAGAVSTRDEESKRLLMEYGIGANRISANGDPALALAGAVSSAKPDPHRVGVVLADGIPSRDAFGVEPHAPTAALLSETQALLKGLLDDPATVVTLFHDDTNAACDFADTLAEGTPEGRVAAQSAEDSLPEIQARMAECSAILSVSLHGLILGAGAGVPVAGCASEPGAEALLHALGLDKYLLPAHENPFAASEAVAALQELARCAAELRPTVAARIAGLRKKEMQNARMMELLVPRRVAFERQKDFSPADEEEDEDEDGEVRAAPRGKRRPPMKRRD